MEEHKVKELGKQYNLNQAEVYEIALDTFWEQRAVDTAEKARVEKALLEEEKELLIKLEARYYEQELEHIKARYLQKIESIGELYDLRLKKTKGLIDAAENYINDAVTAASGQVITEITNRCKAHIKANGITKTPGGEISAPSGFINTLTAAEDIKGRVSRDEIVDIYLFEANNQ